MRAPASILALCFAACSSSTPAYRVGGLNDGWRRLSVDGGDIAFKHQDGGTIFANRMCKGVDDVPLDVLTNHLFFDMRVVREISRKEITLAGRGALRTHVIAELDGVPVELDIVVLKKDGCTYDMALVAEHEKFDQRRPDFEVFLSGFEKRDLLLEQVGVDLLHQDLALRELREHERPGRRITGAARRHRHRHRRGHPLLRRSRDQTRDRRAGDQRSLHGSDPRRLGRADEHQRPARRHDDQHLARQRRSSAAPGRRSDPLEGGGRDRADHQLGRVRGLDGQRADGGRRRADPPGAHRGPRPRRRPDRALDGERDGGRRTRLGPRARVDLRSEDRRLRLDRAAGSTERLLAEVEQRGGARMVGELARASGELAQLLHAIREGNGIVHTLIYEEDQTNLVQNLAEASRLVKKLAEEVDDGKGTVGGLLKDPTVYRDLKNVLGEVRRNVLLKALIRMTIDEDQIERTPRIEGEKKKVASSESP